MNLVESLAAERQAVIDEVQALAKRLESEARTWVEREGSNPPIVIILDGSVPEYHHPTWANSWEKTKAFDAIRDSIKGRPITASIYSIPTSITTPEGEYPAITVAMHTQDWKEIHFLPYRITNGKVEWAKPIVAQSFQSNLFDSPYQRST
jgi:hypothetical protein